VRWLPEDLQGSTLTLLNQGLTVKIKKKREKRKFALRQNEEEAPSPPGQITSMANRPVTYGKRIDFTFLEDLGMKIGN